MTKIHVIIPVYNAKKYLQNAVNSVLHQPCQNIDIVLVNDGSTDGSAELCNEIALSEERVTVLHQSNSGVSAARNTGIEYILQSYPPENYVNRDYIAFLDADDLWLDAIFDEVLIHELSGECLADVIVFGGTSCNETASRFAFPLTFSKESRPGGNEVIWKSPVHFCAHLYRVDLLGHYNIRFTSGLKYAEDKIFNQQCLFLADRVQYMSRLMHLHRQNSASAMSKVLTYSPIDYYTPIINGWISSDQFINSYVSETGKTSTAGYVLAGIYFLDMAADHYKRWKSPQELASVKSHPHYHLFENMAENCVSPQQYKNHHLLLHHPLLFKWKYNAIGAVEYLARKILHIRPIYSFWQKKKYPLSSLPDIK